MSRVSSFPLLIFAAAALILWGQTSARAQFNEAADRSVQPDLNSDGQVDVRDLVDLLNLIERVDLDRDGIWDHEDDCIGWYDTCGICNGPGPQHQQVVDIVPILDSMRMELTGEWFVFQVGADTLLRPVCDNPGCTDPLALNFDPHASQPAPETCRYAPSGDPCNGMSAVNFHENVYPLVAIGDQCWFAENLRTEKFTDGTAIPTSREAELWSNLGSQGLPALVAISLGGHFESAHTERFYNFEAIEDARGVCPSGWRVPSDADWQALMAELGVSSNRPISENATGTALKARPISGLTPLPAQRTFHEYGQWVSYWDGEDAIGFRALPVGLRDRFGFQDFVGHAAAFWSATEAGKSFAWSYFLGEGNPEIARMNLMKSYGLSVRCVH